MLNSLRQLLLTVMVILTSASIADARNFYVRKTGNDARAGTSASTAWASLKRVSQETLAVGDVVYVGAGTYDGTVTFNKMSTRPVTTTEYVRVKVGKSWRLVRRVITPTNTNIQLVADTTGSFTGDKGDVILRGDLSNYALSLEALTNWEVNGFRFQNLSPSRPSYGIFLNRGSISIAVKNCRFEDLVTGITCNSTSTNSLYPKCSVAMTGCTFINNTSWNVLSYDLSEVTATGCTFQNTNTQVGGIYIGKQGDAQVTASTFTGGTYGINAADADDIVIDECTINGVIYPAYGTSDTALIDTCTIKSATYGVWIQSDVTQVEVTDSNFSTCHIAVMAPPFGLQLDTVTITDTNYALWIDGRIKTFTLDPSAKLTLQRNGCEVYVEHRTDGSRPQINIESMSFTGNSNYSILAQTGDVSVRNCRFSGNNMSIYATPNLKSLSIRGCSFAAAASNWQVYATAASNSVRDSSFTDCTYGLHFYSSTANKPDIANLNFTNGSYAIYAYNTPIDINQNTNVTFNNAYLGWYLVNSPSAMSKVNITGAQYPVYTSGGTLSLTDSRITGGVYSVYATGFTKCDLARNTISGSNGGWGVYLSGQNVTLSDTNISNHTNGLFVQDTGATTQSQVSNLTVENNSNWGAYWVASDFALGKNQKSIFRNNGYGLGLYQRDLNLTSTTDLLISGNNYGIYLNQGDANLDGATLAGNNYGILQYYGSITCRNSTITGGSVGLYQYNGSGADVSDSTFSGSTAYGLLVTNYDASKLKQQVTVRNSTFTGCGNGIYAYTQPDGTITIDRTTITGGSQHGIQASNGATQITNSTITKNSNYGILTYDAPVVATDNTIGSNSSYGVYAQGSSAPGRASLTLRRNQMLANRYGVGLYQVGNSEISNNVITGSPATGYGVVSHGYSGITDIWNNTIVDQYIGIYHYGGNARVKNNIVTVGDLNAAKTNSYGFYRLNSATLDASNNLLFGQTNKYYGLTRGVGDVIKPPRFVDRANGNYRLATGSPAINAGIDAGSLVTTDIANNARPANRGFEIGAYEYTGKSGSVRVVDWREAPKATK